MFSFIDPGPFPHRSLGPGLWNNFCDQHNVEWSQAVRRGFPHKKKKLKIMFCSPSFETWVQLKNKSEQRHSCTNWKAEAGWSSLAGELMGSGRQRSSGSSQLLPNPNCARSKQVAHRERAACGEEKVEKGNKRGRKQRGDEAIAVKWQWGNDRRKAFPCVRKRNKKSHKNYCRYIILLFLSANKSITGTSESNKNNRVPNHPKSAMLYLMKPPTTYPLWPGVCCSLLLLPCSCPWPSKGHVSPLPFFGVQVWYQSWIEM